MTITCVSDHWSCFKANLKSIVYCKPHVAKICHKTVAKMCRKTMLIFNYYYRKFPKYSDTQTTCCNHYKIWTMWLYHRVMSLNNADRMANNADPDQTAPRSSLIRVYTVCPGISVRKLRIITVLANINLVLWCRCECGFLSKEAKDGNWRKGLILINHSF